MQARYLEAIAKGVPRETAARFAGIGVPTMYRWMSDHREPYRQFREAVEAAEAQLELGIVAPIASQAPADSKLGLEFLARRFPRNWAPVRGISTADHDASAVGRAPRMYERHLDPEVRSQYAVATPAERWAKVQIAIADENFEEQHRLFDTCPPGDHHAVHLRIVATQLAVASFGVVWLQASWNLTSADALRLCEIVKDRRARQGRRGLPRGGWGDGAWADERADPHSGSDIQIRDAATAGAEATVELRSIWAGFCGFANRLGFADPNVLLAVFPGMADDVRIRLGKLEEAQVDADIATELNELLWGIWNGV